MSPRLPTGIKRLPSGRFEAVACLPSRKKARRRFDTATDARNWRIQVTAEAKARRAPARIPDFPDALRQYKEWASGRREATAKWTAWICNRLQAVPYFQKRLDLITSQDVERWRRELLEQGLSSRTVDHYTERLKRMFSLFQEWGVLRDVPKLRLSRENPERVRYLTQAEEKALLKACPPRLRRVVLVAMNTGARKGELLGLRWAQVNLETRTIRIDATSAKGKKDRVLFLNEAAVRALGKRKKAGAYVFPAERGGRYWSLKRAWEKAIEKSKIKDFHFHDLRHTFASRLVQAGEDVYTVSKLLGHASIAQTERYAHLAPGKFEAAVARLDKVQGAVQKARKRPPVKGAR